ncbi:hypothetical protein [Brevundimonas naejangsanensis]|uniref:hypothetical protein n=1 Tax=Brevundimonas naejangsanensis TaxID=588932 RepID=UPI0026EA8973|nr:hypothetical protein [Brevundimonas naejangsanensis]
MRSAKPRKRAFGLCAAKPNGRWRLGRKGSGGDRDLAQVFFANGEGFLPRDHPADPRDGRDICYATAIAAELAPKAFLLSQGWDDDRCRREVRHDLETGLLCARAEGLDAPRALDDVLGVLNIYYPKHAFDRFVLPAGDETFPTTSRIVVADLFDRVRPHVEAGP